MFEIGAPFEMNEFEKAVPVMPGATSVTVTLANNAAYPPAYRPNPVAVVISVDAKEPDTLHDTPGAVADPQAWLPLSVKLNLYHVL